MAPGLTPRSAGYVALVRRLSCLLSLLLLAALVPSVPLAGASAGAAPERTRYCANGRPSAIYRDSTTDGPRGVEASGIGVWNKDGDACYWVTATGRFDPARTQVIRVLIDTDLRYQGYEYEAWAYSNKDSDYRKTRHLIYWRDSEHSEYVDCTLYSAFGQREVRLGITKTCLGSPGHIRVHVEVVDIKTYGKNNTYRGVGDVIPDRTFYTALI